VADEVFGQEGSFTTSLCNTGNQPGGPVSARTLCNPFGATFDLAGNLYIADSSNSRVLEYDNPLPCAANFGSPRFVPVDGRLSDVVVDDVCGFAYFTNQTLNRVEVFSLRTGVLESPIPVGMSPSSLDITPDGNALYVTNAGGNDISVVNVNLRQEVRKIHVPPGFSNDRPYSIAIANNGLALFSTTFPGSGSGARMMQLDLATDAFSQRTDFGVDGRTTERTHLRASGDRNKIAIVVGDDSSGPVFVYTAFTNSFTPGKDLNTYVASIATDHTGSTFLVNPGTYVLDSNLNVRGTIPAGPYGVAADPLGTVGYSVGQSELDVLDLTTLQKIGGLPLGDTVTDPRPYLGLAGRMAIGSDGQLVAVVTDHGFSIIQPGLVQSTPTPTPAPTPTPTPDPRLHDGRAKKIGAATTVVLSDGTPDVKEIHVQVRNDGDHAESFGVYVDVVPPGGKGNPYACTPVGRVIDTVVTLAPDEQTVVAAFPTFSCGDVAGAQGQTYAISAAVDVHGDDGGACAVSQIQSMGCYNALADDDGDDADNRVTMNAFRVK